MAEIVDISGRPATHDANGVKVTMPYVVQITASFIVEARDRTQAAMAIQRATSFSAGIAPFMLGCEVGADQAPMELVLKLKKAKE
jgi:hypothetical protein